MSINIEYPGQCLDNLSEDEQRDYKHVFEAIDKAYYVVKDEMHDSREKSLALTKIEESAQWVRMALRRNGG